MRTFLSHTPKACQALLLMTCLLLAFFSGLPAQAPDWSKYTDTRQKLLAIKDYGADEVRRQQFAQAIPVFNTGPAISRQASLDSFSTAFLHSLGIAYRYRSLPSALLPGAEYLHGVERLLEYGDHVYFPAERAGRPGPAE